MKKPIRHSTFDILHSPSDGGEIVLYDATDGGPAVEVRLERDTVWLSQEQMAVLFDVQKAAVSKHLKNIFGSGELERAATVSKMETVQQEGALPHSTFGIRHSAFPMGNG